MYLAIPIITDSINGDLKQQFINLVSSIQQKVNLKSSSYRIDEKNPNGNYYSFGGGKQDDYEITEDLTNIEASIFNVLVNTDINLSNNISYLVASALTKSEYKVKRESIIKNSLFLIETILKKGK